MRLQVYFKKIFVVIGSVHRKIIQVKTDQTVELTFKM